MVEEDKRQCMNILIQMLAIIHQEIKVEMVLAAVMVLEELMVAVVWEGGVLVVVDY